MERGWREMAPNCPRCGSTNTKFCYYNNYSLTQPRYFCKGCRRYWTKGGSLRNVPVGGGCRKSRRGSKPSLRVASVASTTPYPNDTPNSCRRTISAFGHVVMNSDGPSSSSSSSASTIDLAVVYANFLNPKGPQNDNFHDRLIIPPLDQIPNNRIYNGDQEDHLLLLHHHHRHHHLHNKHEDQGLIPNPNSFAYDHGTLLPPLPGEEDERIIIPWEKNNNTESNAVQSTIQDPLETETPFSSLFSVDPCWSPFDFSGYSDIQTTTPAGAARQDQWP